ncbi:MAG: hypothetical protein R2681_16410 [Pyrinomonadaceae bacterium]
MTFSDVIIIYLACGTPYGVHFFLKNRNNLNLSWLKALLVTCLWIPFALLQLHPYVTDRLTLNKKSASGPPHLPGESTLDVMKKEFERFLPDNYSTSAVFNFRDILESYSGLTAALTAASLPQTELSTPEIFSISGHSSADVGAVCLSRRNLSRLISHQKNSKFVFLGEIKSIFGATVYRSEFGEHTLQFFKLIGDAEAFELISEYLHTQSQPAAEEESSTWNLEQQKPLILKKSTQDMKSLTATAGLLKKN